MVCGTCTSGMWFGLCIAGAVIGGAAIGLMGFYLYRRNKKTNKPSTAQQ